MSPPLFGRHDTIIIQSPRNDKAATDICQRPIIMARRAVRIATYLGLPVFGLAVGLLLVEVGLRIAGISYPSIFDIDLLRWNADGHSLAGKLIAARLCAARAVQ